MATQYTDILKLGKPETGQLDGTWGTELNDKTTDMIEEAIAGMRTINAWSTNSASLASAEGTTSTARAAIIKLTDTSTNLDGAGTLIVLGTTKVYFVDNQTAQIIQVKTSGAAGVFIAAGKTASVFCDGTTVKQAGNSLESVLDVGNTTSGKDLAVSAGDDITFTDSSKAIFGEHSDLQIYHSGSNSYISESGTGSLFITGFDIQMGNVSGANNFVMDVDGAIDLKHGSGALAISTSATGVDLPAGKAIKVGTPSIYSGSGTPESTITAVPGSLYMNSAGGENTSLYVKESGTGNTGWVAK